LFPVRQAQGRALRRHSGGPWQGGWGGGWRLGRRLPPPAAGRPSRIAPEWFSVGRYAAAGPRGPGPLIRSAASVGPVGRLPRQTSLRPSTLRVPEPSPTDQRRPKHRCLVEHAWPSGGSKDAPEFFKCFRVVARKLSYRRKNQPVRTEAGNGAPVGYELDGVTVEQQRRRSFSRGRHKAPSNEATKPFDLYAPRYPRNRPHRELRSRVRDY
jgi:hypothetical protein